MGFSRLWTGSASRDDAEEGLLVRRALLGRGGTGWRNTAGGAP